MRATLTDWDVAVRWAVATSAGWLGGFILCELVAKPFVNAVTHIQVDGAVVGISIGVTQSVVMSRFLRGRRAWIVMSIVGFAVGKLGGDATDDAVSRALSAAVGVVVGGAVIGAAVGIAQWVVLRGRFANAWWWIPANVLAWGLAWPVITAPDEAAGLLPYVVGVVGAALAGVVTGVTLRRFLRSPLPASA